MESIKDNKYYECGNGWIALIEQAKTIVAQYNLKHPNDEPIKFTQIKEKWGGLRLYINYYVPELTHHLQALENKSFEICEHCGTNKNVKTEYTHGWLMTLCDECRKKELENFYQLKEKLDNKLYNNENN